MTDDRAMTKSAVSGFPEWLPSVRAAEQRALDVIRAGFERYGFASVETPAAEELEALMSKGETSHEVYALQRVQEDEDGGGESRLGLHFDLTVPFARYVGLHFNDLTFPFKRYQMQKVWRGERAQDGRYREFMQCDVDVINVDRVPLSFDAELIAMVNEIFAALSLPGWTIKVNNRKVLQGFYEGLGIVDPVAVIRCVDKLDKIGADGVRALLLKTGLDDAQADACLKISTVRGGAEAIDAVRELGVSSELLTEGLDELGFVLAQLSDQPQGTITVDMSVARGLDYYTGTVYEGMFLDWPSYGSICSGGRYENLASSFSRRHLPGVGISIGWTRIFAKLLAEEAIAAGPVCPTQVMVVLPSEELRPLAREVARALRARGLNVETYHDPDSFKKQLRYASRRAIPYLWFPPTGEGEPHEVKDMASGEQGPAEPDSWAPAGA